jgi:DNA-binding transcriptional ArsR family regulator
LAKKRPPIQAAQRLKELDAVVSALAHASRRQILLVVHFRGGEMTAGEIASRFRCAWPTISRHLRVLEDAGLLVQEKRGRTRNYRIDQKKMGVVAEWLRWFDGDDRGKQEKQRSKV